MSLRLVFILQSLLLSIACGRTPPPSHPSTIYEFNGSCAWARPIGPQTRYRKQLRTVGPAGDTIQVRSTAHLDASDASNRIGRVPTGVLLAGEGPLHVSSPDGRRAKIAYAIAVRDTSGRSCRGYVDAAQVRVLASGATAPDRR